MNNYYYIDDLTKQQCGPFALVALESKNIRPQTIVWCAGMTNWVEAKTVAELHYLVNVPPIPPNTSSQSNNKQYSQQDRTNTRFRTNSLNNIDTRPMPKSWLVESILATFLCCQPFGIVGIVYATKVESRYYAGDYDAAMDASKNAKLWTLISVGLTVGGVFLMIMVYIVFILALFSSLY